MGQKNQSLTLKKLKEGDYILVYWLDIVGSHSGDKQKADLAPCVTGGYFAGFKQSQGKRALITRDTWHPEGFDEPYEGYDIYPMNVVLKVEKIKELKDIKWPT